MGWTAPARGISVCAKVVAAVAPHEEEPSTMQPTTIGLDLAKHVFPLHGVAEGGQVVLRRQLRRSELLAFFKTLQPCLIGMEACASAHYWGRELSALGHTVRLMPATYVKPYVKRGKSDAIDAEAICEAVTRPTMRFVPIKTAEQQSVVMLHRSRDLLVRQRTMLVNALRGHLAEFGVVGAKGISRLPDLLALARVVRDGQSEPEQVDDGADQPLGLSQRQTEHGPERQCRQDRQRRIPALPAAGRAWLGLPGRNRLVRKPHGEATSLAQGSRYTQPNL
jgi:transposase